MSIYATLWRLKFPRYGDDHTDCEWIGVIAQGVPAHIGTPTPGYGYEEGDPYSSFLPPAIEASPNEEGRLLRAVVIVTEGTPKGTERSVQEYVNPLLTLSGKAYATLLFGELHERICNALRGGQPRWIAESWNSDGNVQLLFEDGSSKVIRPRPERPRNQTNSLAALPKPSPGAPLQQLHDPVTGRLDASKVADYLSVPLNQLSGALGKNYSSVHKTPAAVSLQPRLRSIKRILEILEQVFPSRSSVLAWLNCPHPDLGGRTPLAVILEGYPDAVEDMLEGALLGIPS